MTNGSSTGRSHEVRGATRGSITLLALAGIGIFASLIWISVVGLVLYGAVVLAAQVWAPWAEGVD